MNLHIDSDGVESGVHDIDPAVLGRQHEQRHQSLNIDEMEHKFTVSRLAILIF